VSQPRSHLGWAIAATIVFFFPTGLVALWFSLQVREASDPEGAARAARVAKRWIIVSVIVGVLLWAFILAGLLLLGATNPFAS
jgi:hypothetical protein